MTGTGENEGPHEEVGSVGEEALKLLGALSDWAKESGSEYAGAAADAAAGAASAAQAVNEHLATGGKDCKYCPVCQVISTVRQTSPEVRQHLASAATSLLHAAAGVLATHVDQQPARRPSDAPVEKIDLSDEDWSDEDWSDEKRETD